MQPVAHQTGVVDERVVDQVAVDELLDDPLRDRDLDVECARHHPGLQVGQPEVTEPADRGLSVRFQAATAQLDRGPDLLVAGGQLVEAAALAGQPVGEQAWGPLPAGG